MSILYKGGEFSNVDQADAPEAFVQVLDARSRTAQVQARKQRILDLMRVQPGERLLDAGCGTGEDVRAMAQLVGIAGRVVGIDASEVMIREARLRSEGLNLPVEFQVGKISALDFPDGSFDGCHADRVLVHLDDPASAVRELVRVTRPGGRIVLAETDQDSRLLDAPDHELTRKIMQFRNNERRNPRAGRQLYRLCQEAGLTDVVVMAEAIVDTSFAEFDLGWRARENAERARQAGVISAAEAAAWVSSLEAAGSKGHFLAAVTVFLVRGQKA